MDPHIRLLADRIITQQTRRLTELLGRAHDLVNNPPVDTAARSDLDHVTRHGKDNGLAGLKAWAHAAAALNVSAAAEHLEGVRAVLQAQALLPLPPVAHVFGGYT